MGWEGGAGTAWRPKVRVLSGGWKGPSGPATPSCSPPTSHLDIFILTEKLNESYDKEPSTWAPQMFCHICVSFSPPQWIDRQIAS
jgi:hypothetical protein